MPRGKQSTGVAEFQALVDGVEKRVRREMIEEELRRLQGLVADAEQRLRALDGKERKPRAAAKRGRKKGGGRRPAGGGLRDYVVKAFEGADKPLTTAEVAEKVMQGGYKTSAKPANLRIMLVKVLGDKSLFKKVKRGVYKLKK